MKFEELPDWNFEVLETSANVYRVTGIDSHQRKVERQGLDPDALLEAVKKEVFEIAKGSGSE